MESAEPSQGCAWGDSDGPPSGAFTQAHTWTLHYTSLRAIASTAVLEGEGTPDAGSWGGGYRCGFFFAGVPLMLINSSDCNLPLQMHPHGKILQGKAVF